MASMNCGHLPDHATQGEQVVFGLLKHDLPDDYFVWYEPALLGARLSRRPDFLVLGRDIGLTIVEVKDWGVPAIRSANKDTFELSDGQSVSVRPNPEKQVWEYKIALMEELERYKTSEPAKYRSLLQTEGPHAGKLAVPVSGLIVFPNIKRADWQSSEFSRVVNDSIVIFKDDLTQSLLDRFIQARLFRPKLSPAQMDTLRWMLYPEIRIPGTQPRLLDVEQTAIACTDVYLPPELQAIATKPRAKLVRGAVGSGKTLVLLYRAKFISEVNPRWRILVLTFNKSLMGYMQGIFEQIGGDPARVEIVNFHRWCYSLLDPHGLFASPQDESSQRGLIRSILNETGVTEFTPEFLADEFDWIKERIHYKKWADYLDPRIVKRVGRGRGLGGDEQHKRQVIYDLFGRYQERLARGRMCDWADLPVRVSRAMDEGVIAPGQYHAVLVDEAQDFAPAWFRIAFEMVKPETNMIFIVGDGAQKIYRRDFTWKELGLGVTRHNSYVLTRSYRSTYEIVDVALEVIRDSQTILQDLESCGDGIIEPGGVRGGLPHGLLPVLLVFETPQQEYAEIGKEIRSLLRQGYLPKDIAVLHRRRNRNLEALRELQRQGIACRVITKNTDVSGPTVKICTLHSAKGLEFEVVFVCGLEDLSGQAHTADDELQQRLDRERKLLYVGLTRARKRLYITCVGAEPRWIVSRLQSKLDNMRSGI